MIKIHFKIHHFLKKICREHARTFSRSCCYEHLYFQVFIPWNLIKIHFKMHQIAHFFYNFPGEHAPVPLKYITAQCIALCKKIYQKNSCPLRNARPLWSTYRSLENCTIFLIFQVEHAPVTPNITSLRIPTLIASYYYAQCMQTKIILN